MLSYKRYHILKILRQYPIDDHDWRGAMDALPLLRMYDAEEKAQLRELTTLFLHYKQFRGVQGMEINTEVRLTIAAQACAEILQLGLDAYSGWIEVIVYPGAFRVTREQTDELGLVSMQDNVLSGEAWGQGPVILSWDDVARDSYELHHGRNVVIHEFAHKLDMLNGRANGMPPLHPEMPIEKWTEALSHAYNRLVKQVENGKHTHINPYAATNPAEFFAVLCEYFFTAPELLHHLEPKVYRQLKHYFLQDPLRRQSGKSRFI